MVHAVGLVVLGSGIGKPTGGGGKGGIGGEPGGGGGGGGYTPGELVATVPVDGESVAGAFLVAGSVVLAFVFGVVVGFYLLKRLLRRAKGVV